jgi:hypothetical protein
MGLHRMHIEGMLHKKVPSEADVASYKSCRLGNNGMEVIGSESGRLNQPGNPGTSRLAFKSDDKAAELGTSV